MDLKRRVDTARALADEAASLALDHFQRRAELRVEKKGLQDLVSRADREVEALIRDRLAQAFPNDALLGEEGGGGTAEGTWVVDPIDGTTNFLRGLPHWGVSIGFVLRGRVELGVIHAPALGERYVATRGGGATLNGERIRVSDTSALPEALLGLGSSRRTPLPPYTERLAALLQAGVEYRRLGSATMHFAAVARGSLDGYFEAHLSAWDACAGLLLVEEAGGRTNDFLAGDGLREGNAALVAGPGLYPALAAALGVG